MKKVEELERPMICPFRSETHYEYANIDGNAIVIDTQTETFPECYGGQCPLYKFEVGRGFYCAQADTMGGATEEDE